MTAPTADDLEMPARTLFAAASAILTGLAKAKYDGQTEVTGKLLKDLGVELPPAADVEEALGVFRHLNKLTTPAADDPKAGFVPSVSSCCSQKVGEFA